jgi:hypothetical protein
MLIQPPLSLDEQWVLVNHTERHEQPAAVRRVRGRVAKLDYVGHLAERVNPRVRRPAGAYIVRVSSWLHSQGFQ